MTYIQAILIGLLQGVTELFPVSSLGHTVILPSLLGWTDVVAAQSAPESYYLAFLVGLHVATALALLVFYWRTWVDIVRSLLRSIRRRSIETSTERLGWLLVVGSIPAALAGLLLEHTLRTFFAVPLAASLFLVVNGLILAGAEVRRRQLDARRSRPAGAPVNGPDRRLDSLAMPEALAVGVAQTVALLPGISRSGITMAAGLVRGLDHEDAARFSFLLATPIILGAGVYKLGDLVGPNGRDVLGPVLAGSVAAFGSAYLSVRFLTRFFRSQNLMPFAIYSLVVGGVLTLVFALPRPS